MEFELKETSILEDGSERIKLFVPGKELVFLGFVLESLEGRCNYTTVKDSESYLQIDVPPDFIEEIRQILNFLKKWKI